MSYAHITRIYTLKKSTYATQI